MFVTNQNIIQDFFLNTELYKFYNRRKFLINFFAEKYNLKATRE